MHNPASWFRKTWFTRRCLRELKNAHNSVTVQNRTHVYMNFFHHKDVGNHLLQLCPKVVKHPVDTEKQYTNIIPSLPTHTLSLYLFIPNWWQEMCTLCLCTVHTSCHPTLQHHNSYNRTETIRNETQSDLLMIGVKTPETR